MMRSSELFEMAQATAIDPSGPFVLSLDTLDSASSTSGPSIDAAKKLDANQLLMIAYHFPPCHGSSGMQRTLRFARHLANENWRSLVLTTHQRAYERLSDDQEKDIPDHVAVTRAFTLDTARHLSLRGRYFGWMAIPDRWATWWFGAIPAGLQMIRRHRPKALWSTCPMPTAHLIGATLSRLSGLPWIADFRDPMVTFHPETGSYYPSDPLERRARLWIERLCVRHATRLVFCTPGAMKIAAQRYPEADKSGWVIIENGYDEECFEEVERSQENSPRDTGKIVLVHSGTIYPSGGRDPRDFLDAVKQLSADGEIGPQGIRIVLRATGYDDSFRPLIVERGLQDVVELAPPLPYRQALAEMMSADGLLLFQGTEFNTAVPAKLYEYIRAGRPILALTDDQGDTAALLRRAAIGTVLPLDDPKRIADGLRGFLAELDGEVPRSDRSELVAWFSREHKAKELAALLNEIID